MLIEFFILGMIGSWIISNFAVAGPRRVPMSNARYLELRHKRLIEGGKIRWEPQYESRPIAMSNYAWA